MRHVIEGTLHHPVERVWQVVADLRHVQMDGHHTAFRWIGERRRGPGTTFEARLRYYPIFPMPSDTVVGRVIEWKPARRLVFVEQGATLRSAHVQRLELRPSPGGHTRVTLAVHHAGLPSPLRPWSVWAGWQIRASLYDKLAAIRAACAGIMRGGAA